MKHLELMAFDIGASNGRATSGSFDGERLVLSEQYRFDNNHVASGTVYYWDVHRIFDNLKKGFAEYKKNSGGKLAAFGIDTWGVDYGLLDAGGNLLDNPRAYRSSVDSDMLEAWKAVSKREIYSRTGIAAMNFNTVYQLYRRKLENDEQLKSAQTMLLMPDLLGYFFTGEKASEYTNVTTTNLYDTSAKNWDWKTINGLGLPKHIFTAIDYAGTLRGNMLASVAFEIGIEPVPLAAVGSHDTASAVAAVPGSGSFAFCSSGTWSLFGVETDEAILTDEVFNSNFSNEGTVQGGFRPLKNIMGLWLIQECRRDWEKSGLHLSWNDIMHSAEKETSFRSIIDPDYHAFFTAGGMENKIREYCIATNQPVPQTPGQTARCIYESLALKYRWAVERLEAIKGKPIDTLNIVGGGTLNKLLNQMAADATGRRVITGPTEGTCIGNLLMQAVALGELSGIEDVREVVKRSFATDEYEPRSTQGWEDAYNRMIGYMEVQL